MNHTPGPWIQIKISILTDEDDPQMIAYCDSHRNRALRVLEEHLANARLIAAAPDLLACLVETTNELDNIIDQKGHTGLSRGIRDRAYAAIAKARGEAR